MATVRMSNKLTADLCKEYEKSYQNTKPKPEYPASLGDAIYDTHVKPIVDRIKEAAKLDDVEFFELNQDNDDSFFLRRYCPVVVDPRLGGPPTCAHQLVRWGQRALHVRDLE